MYYSIMTIGKPGGCKSTANAKILYEMKRLGFDPVPVSDRVLLETEVVEDTNVFGQMRGDGSLEGKHSILFDGNQPSGRKVFEVTDGVLLNKVHDNMVEMAGNHNDVRGVLFEYATGPDVMSLPREPLLQSGQNLIERFKKYPKETNHHILVVEVDASLEERMRRNGRRVDGMRPGTFLKYFPDGGELRDEGYKFDEMGIQFVRIDNDHDDLARFLGDIEKICETHVRTIYEHDQSSHRERYEIH